MAATDGTFGQWLSQARVVEERLTAEQRGVLQGAFFLSAALRRRLLFDARAQSFPAPLRRGTQGRSGRSLGRHQSAHRLAPARPFLQGGGSGGAPSHGGSASWQAAAALCRTYCRVYSEPSRRHALRRPRLHRADLGGARFDRGLASLLQEVWSGPRDAGRGESSQAERGTHTGRAASA